MQKGPRGEGAILRDLRLMLPRCFSGSLLTSFSFSFFFFRSLSSSLSLFLYFLVRSCVFIELCVCLFICFCEKCVIAVVSRVYLMVIIFFFFFLRAWRNKTRDWMGVGRSGGVCVTY